MQEEKEFDAKYQEMTGTPVSKLITKLAVPTITSMLITSLYNMADTYFVSQIGRSASGAVGVIFSLMAIIQTFGFTVAMGCSVVVSRSLGEKKKDYAQQAISTSFFIIFTIGVIIGIIGLIFLDPLVYILGSTETIAPYAKDYARYILLATPFMASSFVLNNSLRAQGNAFYSMIGLTTGGILNMILDPIFIFGLDLGISGAAIATGLSQFVSFSILLYQSNFRKDSLPIKISCVKPTKELVWKIFKNGMPSFYRQGMASVASILLNIVARPYGDVALASVGIINRLIMFINSALIGFGQGFQPVSGYNFGAKKYKRVLDAYWFTLKVALVGMTILAIVGFSFAQPIIKIFRKDDLEVIAVATLMLQLHCLTLPMQALSITSGMLAQCIGFSFRASLQALARQGIFLIPLLVILPVHYGLFGIQVAQPLGEVFTFILSVVLLVSIVKDIKKLNMLEGE